MRKRIIAVLSLILIIGIFAPTALQASEIGVTIDGVAVDFEGQPPTLIDGRTLVPVRGVFEHLGFEVSWNQDTQTVNLQQFGPPDEIERPIIHWITIRIGHTVFIADGVEIPLDVPAQIIGGRTLLPIRAVLESVGYEVDWDGGTSTVVVTTPSAEGVVGRYVLIRAIPHNTAVTRLDLRDYGLSSADIYPLRYFVNLETLILNDNEITDLAPISGLTNLRALQLNGNQISDLQPLAGLTNLENLGLSSNEITDLSPLTDITKLYRLTLSGNQITDLRPLAGLNSLRLFWAHNNGISNLGPLSNLTNLELLWLTDNQISDLRPLVGLASLEELSLSGNEISDLGPLSGLANLRILRLPDNEIRDIGPLAWLENLTELYLFNNDIRSLAALAGLTNLELLYMGDSPDLGAFGIEITRNQISDWSPVLHVPVVHGRPR